MAWNWSVDEESVVGEKQPKHRPDGESKCVCEETSSHGIVLWVCTCADPHILSHSLTKSHISNLEFMIIWKGVDYNLGEQRFITCLNSLRWKNCKLLVQKGKGEVLQLREVK